MTIFNVFSLLGGLALFLFGMDIMGKALEKQAGGQLQKILSKLTDNPLKGFFLGLCVTAVIQSSSATTVMVVGFVNSGIMELHQAIGVIMGSNVGTTVTSWILSLSGLQGDSCSSSCSSPLLLVRCLHLSAFCCICVRVRRKRVWAPSLSLCRADDRHDRHVQRGASAAGRGMVHQLFTRFSNPLLGVLVGALVTGHHPELQRQRGYSAGTERHRRYHLRQRIPIIMGQNIGTCVTALLSSVGANKNARRAAMVHLYFNIIGVTIFLFGFYGLNAVCHFAFVNTTIEVGALQSCTRCSTFWPPSFCCPLPPGWKSWPS